MTIHIKSLDKKEVVTITADTSIEDINNLNLIIGKSIDIVLENASPEIIKFLPINVTQVNISALSKEGIQALPPHVSDIYANEQDLVEILENLQYRTNKISIQVDIGEITSVKERLKQFQDNINYSSIYINGENIRVHSKPLALMFTLNDSKRRSLSFSTYESPAQQQAKRAFIVEKQDDDLTQALKGLQIEQQKNSPQAAKKRRIEKQAGKGSVEKQTAQLLPRSQEAPRSQESHIGKTRPLHRVPTKPLIFKIKNPRLKLAVLNRNQKDFKELIKRMGDLKVSSITKPVI